MNKLFFRIFIGFWLVTLIALIAGQQLTAYLNREGPRFEETRNQHEQARQFLRQASRRYRRDPIDWERWMRSQQHDFDWLVHRDAEKDFGQRLSWSTKLDDIISKAPPRAFRKPYYTKEGILLIRPLHRQQEIDGYLIARVKPPNPIIAELFYRHLWLRLLAAFLATGAISYWMVRRYTRPIRELRRATQALAAGNLSVRLPASNTQDDLSALRKDFNNMAEQLEESRSRQRALIHDVSHELRTPLARIKAAIALAERKQGESAELVRIADECEYLNQLIDQLLQEPAQIESLSDTLILNTLLADLIEKNALEAEPRQIRLTLQTPPRDIWILAASEALRTAIENVLRNAIRHSPAHGIVAITLAQGNEGDLTITLRDHGSGVPQDMLHKIFLPFFRVDESRQRASGGHGLGLAISKRIVESHNGRITASNAQPGLTVSITLPASLRVEPPREM